MSDKIFRHDTNEEGLIDKEELLNGLEEIFLFDHRKNFSKLEDILASINGAPADKYSKVPDSSHIKSVA